MEVTMVYELDGAKITSEPDFHREISRLLDFGEYYGGNLDALWDRLSTDVERPLVLAWKHSSESRAAMGERFDKIIGVLMRVEHQDKEWGLEERFELRLE